MSAADGWPGDDALPTLDLARAHIEVLCALARPRQALSTPEIERIGADLADRFGRLTTLDGAKVFFVLAGIYCPDLDMSG